MKRYIWYQVNNINKCGDLVTVDVPLLDGSNIPATFPKELVVGGRGGF